MNKSHDKEGKVMKGRNITINEIDEMHAAIGFVKGFCELLYGCYASKIKEDLSGDILYLIGDSEKHLKKCLDILEKAEENPVSN